MVARRAKILRPLIEPHGVYGVEQLARILGQSERTIARASGVDAAAREASIDERGVCGTLPPPFKIGRNWYWTGTALLEWFGRAQDKALRAADGLLDRVR